MNDIRSHAAVSATYLLALSPSLRAGIPGPLNARDSASSLRASGASLTARCD
jgi:hypothetical protein